MRGVLSAAGYVPYRRLDRSEIAGFLGKGGGQGARSVASYDEDTTTMAVEAGRLALRSVDGRQPEQVWFATAEPAYLEKTNATAIHAALRLDSDMPALDVGGAVRSGIGTLRAALTASGTTLVTAGGWRGGMPASPDEAGSGDGASAVLVGEGDGVLAEHLGSGSATEEFVDRWRQPAERTTRSWEERFAEPIYAALADEAWNQALKAAELSVEQVDRVAVVGTHARAMKRVGRGLGVADDVVVDDLSASVGNTGTAHPGLLLASMLEDAEPGQVLAVVSRVDGADVLVFRATDAVTGWQPARTVSAQVDAAGTVTYAKFLEWRGELTPQPPNRPEPGRTSSSVAYRNVDWKFGFVGSRDEQSGALHLPPSKVSFATGSTDMEPAPMADVPATVVTFTVDRLAYSPSPPIVFAVVDFDGGGRFPVELTDVEAEDVRIGDRVEMTFRRLGTSEGIHNYFWKARPIRATAAASGQHSN